MRGEVADRDAFESVDGREVGQASGTADLAWVRTQVFETLGVESFQALTAPMLIDSYPLEQVLASDIPGRMLRRP